MNATKYKTNCLEREFNKQVQETPIANAAFFQIRKEIREQAIKDAQESWETTEVKNSLKRSHEQCSKLEGQELRDDYVNLTGVKARVKNWLLKECRKRSENEDLKKQLEQIKDDNGKISDFFGGFRKK